MYRYDNAAIRRNIPSTVVDEIWPDILFSRLVDLVEDHWARTDIPTPINGMTRRMLHMLLQNLRTKICCYRYTRRSTVETRENFNEQHDRIRRLISEARQFWSLYRIEE